MKRTFLIRYVTSDGTREATQFRLNIPDNEENVISEAGRQFLSVAVRSGWDVEHIDDGRDAVVELTD